MKHHLIDHISPHVILDVSIFFGVFTQGSQAQEIAEMEDNTLSKMSGSSTKK